MAADRDRRLLRTHVVLILLGAPLMGLLGWRAALAFTGMACLGWIYLAATRWMVRLGMDAPTATPEPAPEAPMEEPSRADEEGPTLAEDPGPHPKPSVYPPLNAKPHRWLALVLYFGKLALLLMALHGMMTRYPSLEGPLLGGTLLHVLTLLVEAVRRSFEQSSEPSAS